MDTVLLQFIRHLRHHGIAVSPAETLDAMRVAATLGYSNKQLLYDGLQSCLAKSCQEQAQFAECFVKFFNFTNASTPPQQDSDAEASTAEHDASGNREPGNNSEPGSHGNSTPALPGRGSGGGGQGESLQLELMQAAAEIGLENIRYPSQRNLYRNRLEQALAHSVTGLELHQLEQGKQEDRQRARWLRQRREQALQQAGELVDRQLQLNNQAEARQHQEARMKDMAIGAIDSYYRKQLPELVRKLARKLASRHRQHYRRSHRGRLDLGKTLKQNIAYDGVPFRRHWKSTRKTRSELFVLCDISGSVATWSELLLVFLHALSDVIPKTRSFVFCNESVEVSDYFQRFSSEQAISEIFRQHGMASSGYGSALDGFFTDHGADISRHSTVIILGDGRCNGSATGIESLRKIYQRARLVLWFNPEARNRWDTGDSEIRRFRSACHHIAECGSIRQLERLLDDLLTVLH